MEFKDTWHASTFSFIQFGTSLHHLPFHGFPHSHVPQKRCWCSTASVGVDRQMSPSLQECIHSYVVD